jgi:hypothetical protein
MAFIICRIAHSSLISLSDFKIFMPCVFLSQDRMASWMVVAGLLGFVQSSVLHKPFYPCQELKGVRRCIFAPLPPQAIAGITQAWLGFWLVAFMTLFHHVCCCFVVLLLDRVATFLSLLVVGYAVNTIFIGSSFHDRFTTGNFTNTKCTD